MQTANKCGSARGTQILFKVNVKQSAATEAALPVSNQPDTKLMKPPYRHYDLAYLNLDRPCIDFVARQTETIAATSSTASASTTPTANENHELSVAKTVSPILPPASTAPC